MYSRGKIYKLVSPSNPDLVYYGSTCNELSKRLSQHKSVGNRSSSKSMTVFSDCCIILLEAFPCNSKNELTSKEYEYIIGNKCINTYGRGTDKVNLAEYSARYYKEHKEEILLWKNTKNNCECGGRYTTQNKSTHMKSKGHQSKSN